MGIAARRRHVLVALPFGGSVRSAVTEARSSLPLRRSNRAAINAVETLPLMQFSTALIFLILLLLLPGCGGDSPAPGSEVWPSNGPLPLRLGVSASLLSAPLLIARDQELYEQSGLIPQIRINLE